MDIVEQLEVVRAYNAGRIPVVMEAATEITRLREENKRMKEVLREARDHIQLIYSGIANGNATAGAAFASNDSVCKIIDATLATTGGE